MLTDELREKIDFNKNDPVFLEFRLKGTTINADRYLDTLMKMHQVLENKIRDMFSQRSILHHDHARPHTPQTTHPCSAPDIPF